MRKPGEEYADWEAPGSGEPPAPESAKEEEGLVGQRLSEETERLKGYEGPTREAADVFELVSAAAAKRLEG